MKTWIKAAVALALTVSMALSVSAFIPSERILNKEPAKISVDSLPHIVLPTIVGMDEVTVKSSIASDNVDTGWLFDALPMTSNVLPANKEGGAFLSMAPDGEAYKLGAIAIDTVATAYTFKVYVSNDPDQVEWVEVPVTLDEKLTAQYNNKYQIWRADKLEETYFYCRIVFEAETELELSGVHLYARRYNPHEEFRSVVPGMFMVRGRF